MKLRFLLYPLAWIYGLGIIIRNFLYDNGVFSITGFEYPIISVGNLSVGGTGKTPHVEYLIRLLKPANNVATLSRGYGRKSTGFLIVKQKMNVAKAGDEPLQYKNKFPGVKVTVGEKRVPAMMSLLASYSDLNVVLMDDAFQHRSIKPGFSILLTEYRNLFTDDFLIPVGSLRDLRSSMKRADLVLVTKTPEDTSEDSMRRVRNKIRLRPQQQLFFTYLRYGAVKPVQEGQPVLTTLDLSEYDVLAFSGLARSRNFAGYIKGRCKSVKHLRFPDHYAYTRKDISYFVKRFNQLDSPKKLMLTTEKDWMRIINEPIRKLLDDIPVYTLEVLVVFTDPKEKEIFDQKIMTYVEKNQPNRIFNRKQDRI